MNDVNSEWCSRVIQLGNQVMNDVATDIGETERSSLKFVSQVFMIEPQ